MKKEKRLVCLIRDFREDRGMTQEELSRASGVNRVNISRYETGAAIPSFETAGKIAAVFNVTVDDLFEKVG